MDVIDSMQEQSGGESSSADYLLLRRNGDCPNRKDITGQNSSSLLGPWSF